MDQGSSLNFDFNSQAGVMSLLASIRSSTLSPVEKNELRDLVFLYTNGGGDVSVRIALEQKLVAHKIQPTTITTVPANPAPVLSFGSSRPAPVFKDASNQVTTPVVAPTTAPIPVPAPQVVYTQPAPAPIPVAPVPPVYVQPQPPVQPAPAPIPAQPVPVQPVSVPVQSAPIPVPAPQVVYTQPAPAPVPEPMPVPVAQVYVQPQPPVQPAPAPIPAQPVPVQSVPVTQAPYVPPAPAVASAPIDVNYLDRIREIKQAVNSRVGNPVNLVDINNEVGREYMNALLDAMKKLSGGASSQVEAAMRRLESAYQAVEVAVTAHNQTKSVATPQPVVMPKESEVNSIVTPAEQVTVTSAPISTPGSPIVGTWSQPVTQETANSPVLNNESDSIYKEPVPVFTLSPEEQNISGFNTPSTPEPSPAVAPLAPTPVPTQAPVPQSVTSLANELRVRTPQDLPTADSLATSASGDPLKTRDIDDGLEQLLSDWTLFKKSGLFGTGPRGREHPLFKKIAGLQIPLVLAGRFEGSTQEIKQSITDYMNGWRYEQGIIYEQGETFEHYLRRVIKQILDLQKKRKPA